MEGVIWAESRGKEGSLDWVTGRFGERIVLKF